MSAEPQSHDAEKPKKRAASKVRTGILIVVLLVALAAAGYEFAIARPQWQSASETLGDWAEQALPKTIEDAHKELGKQPSETRTTDEFIMEKYEWRSGLVFRTHKLYVTYGVQAKEIQRTDPEAPAGWAQATPK